MAGVLADVGLVELVPLTLRVDATATDQRRVAALDGRVRVQGRVEVGPRGEVVAHTLAVLVQTDVETITDEEAAVAVVLGLVLVHPGQHVFPGLVLQPAVYAAAQPLSLEPVVLPVLEDGDRAGDVGQRRRAHDTAGHHEARMRPLPAEDRVDLDRLVRKDHAGLITRSDVRREAADRLVVHLGLGVVLVGQVDREQGVEVARNRLQRLARLRDVADQRGVLRHVGFPRGVQRVGGLVQVAAAADPADARTDDEAGLWVLAPEDDLEATEHRGFGPGRGDDTVVDGDSDVEVPLDTAQWADIEVECGHGQFLQKVCAEPGLVGRRLDDEHVLF